MGYKLPLLEHEQVFYFGLRHPCCCFLLLLALYEEGEVTGKGEVT
jgi:hypothetical protein